MEGYIGSGTWSETACEEAAGKNVRYLEKEEDLYMVTFDFDGITERDMDFMFMRKLSYDQDFLRKFFLSKTDYKDSEVKSINIAHSVVTEDGESDIEVILTFENEVKIGLLIEDKIDAPAMKEQAERYKIRGEKAKEEGKYKKYYIFIVAPQKYLETNSEATKYQNKVCYESIKDSLKDPFEKAVIDKALMNYGRAILSRNQQVTEFWNKIYDFAEQNYPGVFKIDGQKGLLKSGIPGQWITIRCNNQYDIEIKNDRGYVDLEIKNYGDKFELFCKDNKDIIDEKKLYIRPASKSLAIRKYITSIDFYGSFEAQEPVIRKAFDTAKELRELICVLKLRPQ